MKYISNKENLIVEIFSFIKKNYKSFSLNKDSWSSYSYFIKTTIYNSIQLKIVYKFNSSDLDEIKLYLDDISITTYDNTWNSKYKLLKKIYNYLKDRQDDSTFTQLYTKIINNKPITETRTEKIKELTK